MGNNASSNHMNRPRKANSIVLGGGGGGGSKNGLGLSKQELDERCRPTGLYKTCQWDDKVLRRLIGDGKLASRNSRDGGTNRAGTTTTTTTAVVGGTTISATTIGGGGGGGGGGWECPICFCNYEEINRTVCCDNEICTECYLQLKPPQRNVKVSCPFCVDERLRVDRCLESAPSPKEMASPQQPPSTTNATSTSEEEKDYLDRPSSPAASAQPRSAYCLTPEQRQKLEAKVAEQQIHPLAARLAQEEAERRLANELQYLTSNPNSIMMQLNSNNRHLSSSQTPFAATTANHRQQYQASVARTMLLTEEQQLAMAIEASLRTASS